MMSALDDVGGLWTRFLVQYSTANRWTKRAMNERLSHAYKQVQLERKRERE